MFGCIGACVHGCILQVYVGPSCICMWLFVCMCVLLCACSSCVVCLVHVCVRMRPSFSPCAGVRLGERLSGVPVSRLRFGLLHGRSGTGHLTSIPYICLALGCGGVAFSRHHLRSRVVGGRSARPQFRSDSVSHAACMLIRFGCLGDPNRFPWARFSTWIDLGIAIAESRVCESCR